MEKLNGILAYVQVQKPVDCYEKSKGKEFKASIIITDKAEAKEFKAYTKKVKSKTTVKEVSRDDFEAEFKIPFPEEATDDEVWVVTLRRNTMMGNTGRPLEERNYPKVLIDIGNKRFLNVTKKKLPANGSKGYISFITYTPKNGESSFYLENVVINSPEDFIEYIPTNKANASLGEGAEILDDEDYELETPKQEAKADNKPKAKAKTAKVADADDEDDPF